MTPLRLEIPTPRSRDKHSSTEPLRSLLSIPRCQDFSTHRWLCDVDPQQCYSYVQVRVKVPLMDGLPWSARDIAIVYAESRGPSHLNRKSMGCFSFSFDGFLIFLWAQTQIRRRWTRHLIRISTLFPYRMFYSNFNKK